MMDFNGHSRIRKNQFSRIWITEMFTNREAVRHNWCLVFTAKLVNDQSWAWGHKTRPGRVINETILQMYRYNFMLYRQFDSEASLTWGRINCMDYIETKVNWGRMNVTYLFFWSRGNKTLYLQTSHELLD